MMSGICSVCGLPGELCICQEIAKEQQCAILSTDRRRYGKIVTKVEGLEDSAIEDHAQVAVAAIDSIGSYRCGTDNRAIQVSRPNK